MIELQYNESILSFTDGITATSANHLCNVAKETYAEIEERHKNIRFYEKRIESLSTEPKILKLGQTKDYLVVLKNDLKILSDLKSFIAYFKEAIKLKEDIYEYYRRKDFDQNDYTDKLPTEPTMPKKITLTDYIKLLPIKEYNRYLSLETKCAVLGSFVHPDGGLSKSRKTLMKILNSPTEVSTSGNETLITSYQATIEIPEIDKIFFDIQKEHRSCQAEFNKLKSDLETEINNKFQEEYKIYQEQREAYASAKMKLSDEFYRQHTVILEQIQKLKIIVPDSLKEMQIHLSSK